MKKEAWKKYMIGGVVAISFAAMMTSCSSEKKPSASESPKPSVNPSATALVSPEAGAHSWKDRSEISGAFNLSTSD